MQFFDLIDREELDENLVLLDKLIKLEIPNFVSKNHYCRKDGKQVWVRKSISLVRNDEGIPQWFLALVEDLSGRQ